MSKKASKRKSCQARDITVNMDSIVSKETHLLAMKKSVRIQLQRDRSNASKSLQKNDDMTCSTGDTIEPGYYVVRRGCSVTGNHKLLGSVDNLNIFLVFSLMNGDLVSKRRTTIAADCPQYSNFIDMLEEDEKIELMRMMNTMLKHCVRDWNYIFVAYVNGLISRVRDVRLAQLMKDDEFIRSMARYMIFKKSMRVRICGVKFQVDQPPQRGIMATSHIPKDTYLWEICGIISSDVLTGHTISSIEAHRCQGMGGGPRLLVGPIRLVNHHCDPNARFFPLQDSPAVVILTTKEIKAGKEVTTSYGADYWSQTQCLCSSCTGKQPVYCEL
ncbi:SET domain-containing protein [Serendipita vermifera]|nr:SET domain-containing protein [Serendipita vermifera]